VEVALVSFVIFTGRTKKDSKQTRKESCGAWELLCEDQPAEYTKVNHEFTTPLSEVHRDMSDT
jgi:hypothetical protein